MYYNYRYSGTHDLGYTKSALVSAKVVANCTYGDVQLVGGSVLTEGRVEICINGSWGTICRNSWNYQDATVICRQLVYPSLGSVYHHVL